MTASSVFFFFCGGVQTCQNVHMCCLFYGVWRAVPPTALFKPCCIGTPWAFKPLGGRYGLVFFSSHLFIYFCRSLRIIQTAGNTCNQTSTPVCLARTRCNLVTDAHSQDGCFVLFLFTGKCYFTEVFWKRVWMGHRDRRAAGEVIRFAREIQEEEEGLVVGWNTIKCHGTWSRTMTCPEWSQVDFQGTDAHSIKMMSNLLWWFSRFN